MHQATHALAEANGGPLGTLRAFVGLTKPRIIELLLVTTVPVMFLAAGGIPPLTLVLFTLIGGCLACDQWLSARVRSHEARMRAEFPTVADLLALSVAAGDSPVSSLDRA